MSPQQEPGRALLLREVPNPRAAQSGRYPAGDLRSRERCVSTRDADPFNGEGRTACGRTVRRIDGEEVNP